MSPDYPWGVRIVSLSYQPCPWLNQRRPFQVYCLFVECLAIYNGTMLPSLFLYININPEGYFESRCSIGNPEGEEDISKFIVYLLSVLRYTMLKDSILTYKSALPLIESTKTVPRLFSSGFCCNVLFFHFHFFHFFHFLVVWWLKYLSQTVISAYKDTNRAMSTLRHKCLI